MALRCTLAMNVHAVKDLGGKGVIDRPQPIELHDHLRSIQFKATPPVSNHTMGKLSSSIDKWDTVIAQDPCLRLQHGP